MNKILRSAVCVALVAVLHGCDSDVVSRAPNGPTAADSGAFGDDAAFTHAALNVSTQLRGVNSDGRNAVVRVAWSVTAAGLQTLGGRSQVRLRNYTNGSATGVIASQPVSEDTSSGVFDIPVDVVEDTSTQWFLELDRAALSLVPNLSGFTVVNLEPILSRKTTPLDVVTQAELELVPDSYTADNVGGRREHNFSVHVKGRIPVNDPNQPAHNTKPVFVTGLVQNGNKPFRIIESGVEDIESPLSVTDDRKDPVLYLVMDVSSSVVQGQCWDDLQHAVSSTIINLAGATNLEYRIFDNEIYRIESTLDLLPISGEASGSALYHSLDRVVGELESWEHRDRDIFIIAFSDGLDLASWNHYDFASRQDVVTHVGRRLNGMALQHSFYNQREFKTFLVGFDPRTALEAQEMSYLALQGRGDYVQMNRDDCDPNVVINGASADPVESKITETFHSLSDHIRSVYHLNYSSQQTHGRSPISLQLHLGDTHMHTLELPERPVAD